MPNEQQGDVLPAHEEGGRIPKGEDRGHGRGIREAQSHKNRHGREDFSARHGAKL